MRKTLYSHGGWRGFGLLELFPQPYCVERTANGNYAKVVAPKRTFRWALKSSLNR